MTCCNAIVVVVCLWGLSVPVHSGSNEQAENPRSQVTEASPVIDKQLPDAGNVTGGQDNHTSTVNTQTLFGFTHFAGNLNQQNGVVMRAFCVIAGVMLVIVVFFIVRTVRSRRKRTKTRKYGIIATRNTEQEMEPLGHEDDDEEETTLFDANRR